MHDALSLSGPRRLPLPLPLPPSLAAWLERYVKVERRELPDGTVNDAMWVN